jgi:hypothetical protein
VQLRLGYARPLARRRHHELRLARRELLADGYQPAQAHRRDPARSTGEHRGLERRDLDRATKDWVYRAIATSLSGGQPDMLERFVKLLDSERRLVLEVVPERYITFDSSKLMAATDWSAL